MRSKSVLKYNFESSSGVTHQQTNLAEYLHNDTTIDKTLKRKPIRDAHTQKISGWYQ